MSYTHTRDEPTAYIGDFKLRTFIVDIDNYDSDGGGNGESFIPDDAQMHRFVHVFADVIDGSGTISQYDENTASIRLLQQSNDGGGNDTEPLAEVPSDSGEGARLRVTCIGN